MQPVLALSATLYPAENSQNAEKSITLNESLQRFGRFSFHIFFFFKLELLLSERCLLARN